MPEAVSIAITTPVGTVLHTGDWKFDPEPVVGTTTDAKSFSEIGNAGVLAMLCDSTNAHQDLPETSEGQVREAFRRLFASRRGQIAVCAFGSNVARIASVAFAAAASGRCAAVAGRSMRTYEEIARGLGMLDRVPEFLAEPRHLYGLDRHEVALVCTGTQGEETASLARLARGDRRLPSFGPGDTVVISARVIPGNEESVAAIVSRLQDRGIEVLTGKDVIDGYPLHVSGHPSAGDLRRLYGLVKPRFAIPVHGTPMHLDAHARVAHECGVEASVISHESEVIRLTAQGATVMGQVHIPLLHLDRSERGRTKVSASVQA